MDRAAYDGMSAIENRHWWFVARRSIIASLIDRIDLPETARILEAGCGTGGNLALLADYGTLDAFEFDDDARALSAAKGICPVSFGALPDQVDGSGAPYDLIAMLDVLEHIDDDRASLATLGHLLARDGRMIVTVPAVPSLWSSHDVLHHHKRRYTREALASTIAAAGLVVDDIGYFNSLLFPLAWAQRFAARVTGSEQPVDSLPAKPLNAALQAVFAAERHMLGRLHFPIGLSLYAIARRGGGTA